MTIVYRKGNIFDQDVDAIVNPVNCKGVMGAGLALQVRNRFPKVFLEYVRACRDLELEPGKVHVVRNVVPPPKYIINLATKDDWMDMSDISYIRQGLRRLEMVIRYKELSSLALPAFGCGLGRLPWADVKTAIDNSALSGLGGECSIIVMLPANM